MKRFLSPQTLAGIAHEILLETQEAAMTKVTDIRSQVEDLWAAVGEKIPTADQTAQFMRRVESAVNALRRRDTIVFPDFTKA